MHNRFFKKFTDYNNDSKHITYPSLLELHQKVVNNEIDENTILALKFYGYRNRSNYSISWEAKFAKLLLISPGVKNYLGLDISDDEMAESVFGRNRKNSR